MDNDVSTVNEEMIPVDLNGDGQVDALALDADKDGYAETMVVPIDADGNGLHEQIQVFHDCDTNGSYETLIEINDKDQDGIIEKADMFVDATEDGNFVKIGELDAQDINTIIADNVNNEEILFQKDEMPNQEGSFPGAEVSFGGSKRDYILKEISDTKTKIAYEQKEIARIKSEIKDGWIGHDTYLWCLENGLDSNQSKLRDLERDLSNLKE